MEPVGSYRAITDWLMKKTGQKELGAVHRLDVETSGLLVIAKTRKVKDELQRLWQARAVKKTYLILVIGKVSSEGAIELPIERNTKKDRMRVSLLPSAKDRPAITRYRRLKVGEWDEKKISLVEAMPVTGRTHQLRVHFKAIKHPIIGDKLYGYKSGDQLASKLGLDRQFLHAWKLEFNNQQYTAPLPQDLGKVLEKLALSIP